MKELNELNELLNKIELVKKRGWIKSATNGSSGIGTTFEKAIGKELDTFEIPDYGSIEIKTKKIGGHSHITLFSATPDSYLFEIKRIHAKYGYPYYRNPYYKVFNTSIYSTQKTSMSGKYDFTLYVDYEKKAVSLMVYNKKGELIDDLSSWSFDMLEEKLLRKLKYLLLIKAEKKYINGDTYYKYKNSSFYILKGFDNFISAIDSGYIRVTFRINVITSGNKAGQLHDHGTSFDIKEEDLEQIYYRAT